MSHACVSGHIAHGICSRNMSHRTGSPPSSPCLSLRARHPALASAVLSSRPSFSTCTPPASRSDTTLTPKWRCRPANLTPASASSPGNREAMSQSEPSSLSLTSFPAELIDSILSHLSPYELVTASATCRLLHRRATSDTLWRPLVQGNIPGPRLTTSYPLRLVLRALCRTRHQVVPTQVQDLVLRPGPRWEASSGALRPAARLHRGLPACRHL